MSEFVKGNTARKHWCLNKQSKQLGSKQAIKATSKAIFYTTLIWVKCLITRSPLFLGKVFHKWYPKMSQ